MLGLLYLTTEWLAARMFRLMGFRVATAALSVVLVLASSSIAWADDSLTQALEAYPGTVSDAVEDSAAAVAGDVEVSTVPSFGGGFAVDSSRSGVNEVHDDSGFLRPQPTRIYSPDMTSGSWRIEFPDGTVTMTLVGRDEPASSQVDGSAAAFSEVKPGVDQVVSASADSGEEFLLVDSDGFALARSFSWRLGLPDGFSASQSDGGDVVISDGPWEAARIRANYAVDRSTGRKFPAIPVLSDDGTLLTVSADPQSWGVVGDWALDPEWYSLQDNTYQKAWCANDDTEWPTNFSSACKFSSSSQDDGWSQTTSSASKFYSALWVSPAYAVFSGTKANQTISSTDYSIAEYARTSSVLINSIHWHGHMTAAVSSKMVCRLYGNLHGGGSSSSSYYSSSQDIDLDLANTSTRFDDVGLKLANGSGGNVSSGSTDNAYRCSSQRTAENGYVRVTIYDTSDPTVDAPSGISSSAWYNSSSAALSIDSNHVFDYGSGAARRVLRSGDGSTILDSTFCTPTGSVTSTVPCTQGADITGLSSASFTPNGKSIQGSNDLTWTVYDYSGRTGTGTATYSYDSVSPTLNAIRDGATGSDQDYQPSDTVLDANWAAGSDSTSLVKDYSWCFTTNTGNSCATPLSGTTTSATNAASTSAQATALSLTEGSTYYFCLKVRDNALNSSAYSCSDGMTVDHTAPSNPAQAGVFDLSTTLVDKKWTASTTALSASWNAGSDGVAGIRDYDLCFSTVSTGCTNISGTTTQTGITSRTATATATGMTPGASYFTCVKAYDNAGSAATSWQCSGGFTVDTQAPATPSTPQSLGRASEIDWSRWYASGSQVRVFYAPVTDSGSGVASVESQYGDGDAGPVATQTCTESPGECPASTALNYVTMTLTASNSTEGSTNPVKFRATDYLGSIGSWGQTRSYKFDSAAPSNAATMAPAPADDATNVGAATHRVSLDWADGSDSTSGVNGYEVRVGTVSDLSASTAEFAAESEFEAQIGVATHYYWQVRTLDKAGNAAAWSSVYDFTVDQTPPTVTLNTPTSEYSKRSAGSDTYAATVSDAGAGVGSVKYQYLTFPQTTWTDLGTASYNSGTGKYEYSGDLPSDGLFNVRVVAVDSATQNANTLTSPPIEVCRDTATTAQPATVNHELVGSQAKVWWTAAGSLNGVSPAGYIVERQENGGSWITIERVPNAVTNVSDQGPLNGGSTYVWRVQTVSRTCTSAAKASTGTTSTASTTSNSPTTPGGIPRVGLEPTWQTHSESLGAGASAGVNIAGGNLHISRPLTSNIGRGIDTNPVLSYNGQDIVNDADDLALAGTIGPNWAFGLDSIAPGSGISTFTGISTAPAEISSSQIILRDADGTKHTFTQAGSPSAYRYNAPAGSYLYVRDFAAANASTGEAAPSPSITGAKYAATRPDRVTFYYADSDPNDPDKNGQLLEIRDRLGNRMIFDYQCAAVPDDLDSTLSITASTYDLCASYTTPPSGTTKRLRLEKITDPGGRDLLLSYYDTYVSGEQNQLGRLKTITDHDATNGVTQLTYSSLGTLASGKVPMLATVIQAYGTSDAQTTSFNYIDSDNLVTPFEDESRRIEYVQDPRENRTHFAYTTHDAEGLARVASITDRADSEMGLGMQTRFAYDLAVGETTVVDELLSATAYRWTISSSSLGGRVERTTGPSGQANSYDYDDARNRVVASHEIAPQIVDQSVQLNGTAAIALNDMPIDTTQPIKVRSQSGGGGTLYVEDTYDYTLTKKVEDQSTPALTGTTEVTVANVALADGHPIIVKQSAGSSSGATFAEGTDFTVTSTNPLKIARISGSSIGSGASVYVTYLPKAQIARKSIGAITDGQTVYVSYTPIHSTRTSATDHKTGFTTSQTDPGETAAVTTYTNDTGALESRAIDPATQTGPRGTQTADTNDFQTTYTYDSSYRLTSVAKPINYSTGDSADLSTTEYGYYSNGNVRYVEDGRGYSTGYSDYDASGLPRRVHEPIAGTFNAAGDAVVDDATTPVDTLSTYSVRGQTACIDDKREAGDSPAIAACTSHTSNKTFSETIVDALGRATVETAPWDGARRRATITAYDDNSNAVSVRQSVGYTPGTSTPQAPDAATPGTTHATTVNENDATVLEQAPPNYDRFKTSTVYALGECTAPTDPDNVEAFVVTSAGTSASAEPTWPTTYEGTVTSGSASLRQSDACKIVTTTELDAAEKVLRTTQPQGNATTAANDYTERYQYDEAGRQVGTLDGENRLRCMFYDEYGNEAASSEPLAMNVGGSECPETVAGLDDPDWVTTSTFDLSGNKMSETDVRGKITTHEYDADGNEVQSTTPLGHTTDTEYDAEGNAVKSVLPAYPICAGPDGADAGSEPDISASVCSHQRTDYRPFTKMVYDAAGSTVASVGARQDAETGDSATHVTGYTFDERGQQTRTSLPREDSSQTQLYTHTGLSALGETAVTTLQTSASTLAAAPAAEKTEFTHDPSGEIVSKSDTANDVSVDSYEYSVEGEVALRTEHSADTVWEYYPDGSLKSRDNTQAGIPLVEHSYNRSGDETLVDEAGSYQDIAYTRFDKTGQVLKSRGTDGRTTTTTYDRNGNILTETTANRNKSNVWGTTGSNRGLLTHMAIVDATTQTVEIASDFTYDDDGRLLTVTRNSSPELVTTYTYNAAGKVTQIRTVRGASDVMQDFDYFYDAAGNIRKADKQLRTTTGLSDVETSEYTYDGQDRVLTDDLPALDKRRYVFNAAGRLDKIENLDCETPTWLEDYSYETVNPNQLTEHSVRMLSAAPTCTPVSAVASAITYGDDTAGKPAGSITKIDNPTTDDILYEYDAQNRQTEATQGVDTLKVTSDALGRRSAQELNGAETNLSYTGASLSAEAENNDEQEARVMLTNEDGQIIGETRDEGALDRYLLTDILGSTVASIDSDGTVKATIDYDTYGMQLPAGTSLTSGTDGELAYTAYTYTGSRIDRVGELLGGAERDYSPVLRLAVQTSQYLDPASDQESLLWSEDDKAIGGSITGFEPRKKSRTDCTKPKKGTEIGFTRDSTAAHAYYLATTLFCKHNWRRSFKPAVQTRTCIEGDCSSMQTQPIRLNFCKNWVYVESKERYKAVCFTMNWEEGAVYCDADYRAHISWVSKYDKSPSSGLNGKWRTGYYLFGNSSDEYGCI